MDTEVAIFSGDPLQQAFVFLIEHIFSTYMIEVYATCLLLSRNQSAFLRNVALFPDQPMVSMVLENPAETMDDPQSRLTAIIELGCHAFVMDQDTAWVFLDLFIRSHDLAMFRNPNKTVIVLHDPDDKNDSDFLEHIRFHPALEEIVRFLVLEQSDDEVNLWTHRYKSSREEGKELILLDSYNMENNAFTMNNNLFPDKTTNMDRRTFRLASFRLIPHFVYTPIDSSENWLATYKNQTVRVDGMGGLVMVEFCKKFNCTWDLSIDQAGEWGMIYDNWTGDGIMGAIAERRADAGVGSLLTWVSAHRFLGFTATIRKVGISCFAPRPQLIASWKTVALVFSRSVWICILLSVVCCTGMFAILSWYNPSPFSERRSLGWNAVNVVAIFLMNGAKILYGTLPECVLSMALIAFTINLGNIFIGKNASLRAFPLFEPPIDTIEDMANRDMIWVQTHEAWVHSLLLTQNPYLMKVADNYRIYTVPELTVLGSQGKVAFGVSKLNYGHYMIGTFINAQNVMLYRMMKDDLYFEYEVSMTTKTWPMKDLLSDLILRIVASGIRAYQEPIVAKRYMDYGVQMKIFHSQDKEEVPPHQMDCEDLLAAFMVLGAGVLLATVAFIGEMTEPRYLKKVPTKWAFYK